MQARNSSGHEARAQPSQRRSPIGEAEGKQSHTKPQPSLARFRVRLQAPCSVTPSHATERPSRQPPRWLCKQPWALMCLRPSSTAPRCPVTTLRSRSANVASSSPPSASGISCIALAIRRRAGHFEALVGKPDPTSFPRCFQDRRSCLTRLRWIRPCRQA